MTDIEKAHLLTHLYSRAELERMLQLAEGKPATVRVIKLALDYLSQD